MATIKELREQAANAATEARSLLNQAEGEKDEARAADLETQHDKAMADYDSAIGKAERLEKLEAAEQRASDHADAEERKDRDNKRPAVSGLILPKEGEMDYRTAFHEYIRAEGQKGSMSPEARAVLDAGKQAVEHRAQTTTAAAGGYTIPTELLGLVTKSMLAWGPMYDPGITTELVTSGGGAITMPTVNDTAKVVVKHVEGTTLTDDGGSDAVFGEKVLNAYAFNTEWLRVSKELADDSIIAMETFLGGLLGERLGRRANLELTVGDGTGDPNGIVTASGSGKVAASTTAITFDEIIDLEHSVDSAYRVSPMVRYMFNDLTLAAVRKLKDGNGNYLWQMGNVIGGVPATFNGHNFSVNNAMVGLGDGVNSRVMLFGDFSKYFVRKVGTPLIGALQDKDFWPGFGVAGYIRFDGELADAAAVKHLALAAS